MKILLEQCHQHAGSRDRKSRRILKKMAKLERKLGKYSFESREPGSSDEESAGSSSSCEELRPGRCRSRSTSCSDSSSDSSSSSGSSSPSPCRRRRRRHHHRHLPRSRSFAGRASCSPIGRQHRYQHHHRRPHSPQPRGHPGRFRHRHLRRHGEPGCARPSLSRSEPNLQDVPIEVREPEVEPTVEMEEDVRPEEVGSPIDPILADTWGEILREGLPAEELRALRGKYPPSGGCPLQLAGPAINAEVARLAAKPAVQRDVLWMREQGKVGTGLAALGRALSRLNGRPEVRQDQELAGVLDGLKDAAALVLDAHHGMTKVRQVLVAAETGKRVQAVLKTCKPDEYLFGKDLGEKVQGEKGFGKCRKMWRDAEERGEKTGKRKHASHDAEKRGSKRLDASGPPKIGFIYC